MNEPNQIWTEEIQSENSLFSVNVKEVWHYRDLLLLLVKRDFITFYKQTILGPIWFFIQPLLTMLVYIILFGQIAKINISGLPQMAFYLSGITIWNYFSESLTKISTVFKDNSTIFGKIYFPRLIMPLSIVLSALMKFVVQFSLFILVVLYFSIVQKTIHPNIWIVATPFLILLMAIFALGIGMIFSALTTKYKDLSFLLTFGIQLFMYATPVVYPISAIPESLKWLANSNPLSCIFECFRYGYLGYGTFEVSDLVRSSTIIILLFMIGVITFNKVEKSFMDTV
jgi:lipopolysaccharide transport system permease protein